MTNTIYIHQPEKAVSFTRLPNFLFEAPTFTPLSNEAKVLYAFILRRTDPVSYTHLDVYKRQVPALCLPVSAEEVSAAPVQKQGVVVQNVLRRDAVKGGELVRQLRREAAVKCAAFQISIEPFLHAHHGGDLFLQQVKTIAAPTQTIPWVRDVGVRVVHTVERLRLYGGAGTCQSYL